MNDGETLRMEIRGLTFVGKDFDALEPPQNVTADQLAQFRLSRNELCSCRIQCEIPITIQDNDARKDGCLSVEVILGEPTQTGALDREDLRITLTCDHGKYSGSGKSGWFEDELLEIQEQLPADVYVVACINCLFSDYSPYGHGAFGCMMCFRNLKTEYLKVKTKKEFWSVHDRYDRMVQETYRCPQFERRIPGTGYRG